MWVYVLYVDGHTEDGPPEDWPKLTPHGVESVTVRTPSGDVTFASQSAYFLYRDGEWVGGCASFGYDPNPITEVVFSEPQAERRVEFFPDLKHEDVKLGWWRDG